MRDLRSAVAASALALLAACSATLPRAPIAPVNAPGGLGLAGWDPVAYFVAGVPTPGSACWTATVHGVTYRFATADNRARFVAAPAAYLPQYGGYCAYAIAHGRIADVDPERWAIAGGRLYLNNNLVAQKLWSLDPEENVAAGDRNWTDVPKLPAAAPAAPRDDRAAAECRRQEIE